MKELTYFKFTIQEWQNGLITMQPDSVQGVFINVCAFYWSQEGNVTEIMLNERFKSKSKTIQKLIKVGLVKQQNGIITISFLDQQLSELKQNKKFYSDMGKLGQIAKKNKAPLKPPLSPRLSYNSIEKNNIKKDKKHPFPKSPFYDKGKFKEALSDWSSEKLKYYWESAEDYSSSHNKTYANWVSAVRAWDRKDPFKEKGLVI